MYGEPTLALTDETGQQRPSLRFLYECLVSLGCRVWPEDGWRVLFEHLDDCRTEPDRRYVKLFKLSKLIL